MTERELQDLLRNLLDDARLDDGEQPIDYVSTYADEGVLTENKGLVVLTNDGDEFQVTIVRSK